MTQSPEDRIAFEERMLAGEPDSYGEYEWLLPGTPSTSGEHIVDLCREIQQGHAAKCIDGVLVDVQTAVAIVTVANNLNELNRAKFMQRRTVESMGKLAQEICFRAKQRSRPSDASKY